MHKALYILLGMLLIMILAYSCKKDDDTTVADPCQNNPEYWTNLTLDGNSIDTRGACNLAYIELDTAFQYFQPVMFGNQYLVMASSIFRLYDDTAYLGRFHVELAVLAPDSIVNTTISGADTTRNIPLQTLCYMLHTGELVFYQSNMESEDKNGGSLAYTAPDSTHYLINLTMNPDMDILGNEGLGLAVLDGDTTDVCICQAGFNVAVTTSTDTILIDGLARLPFK